MLVNSEGRFISFEGGEGVGKSTQVRILVEHLANKGINCIQTREPGGSSGAELIRDLLVKGGTDKWSPISEALLHNAARAEHLQSTILPALKQGQWVISDRYIDSTLAYQGYGQGVELETLLKLHKISTDDFWPHLTIILNGHELGRAKAREDENSDKEDRYERMGEDFHSKLQYSFLEIAKNYPDRCIVVSAEGSIDQVAARILDIVREKFKLK